MKTIFLGKNCIELEEVDSTNSYLLSKRDLFEGTVVVAKSQVQGRGQRGSSWQSEAGKNLTISILLTPTFLDIDQQFQLNKVVSLGVAEFVLAVLSPVRGGELTEPKVPAGASAGASFRPGEVKIKWPNDIYIGSQKVAGILIENSVSGSKLQQSIVGIGINVNQESFSAELPNPTSLKLSVGKELDLKECLEQLCSCIESRYLELRSGQMARIDADYLKSLYRFDEVANYQYKGEILRAKITEVSKTGKLLLETESGEKLECDFKEVGFC